MEFGEGPLGGFWEKTGNPDFAQEGFGFSIKIDRRGWRDVVTAQGIGEFEGGLLHGYTLELYSPVQGQISGSVCM